MSLQYFTKNLSFGNVHNEIIDMNKDIDLSIQSPLLIHDKSLIEIKDIFDIDTKIDEETRSKIINECKINVWYFFREFARLATTTQIINDRSLANRFRFTLDETTYKMIWAYNMGYNFIVDAERGANFVRDTLSLLVIHYNYFLKGKIRIDYQHGTFIRYLFSQILLTYDYIRTQNVDEIYSMFFEDRKLILGSDNDCYIIGKMESENVSEDLSKLNIIFDVDTFSTMIERIMNYVDFNEGHQQVIGFIDAKKWDYTDVQRWFISHALIDIKYDHKYEFINKYGPKSDYEKIIRERNMIFYI